MAFGVGSHDISRVVARNAAVRQARTLGINAPGLGRLRSSFRRLAPEVDKQLRRDLYRAAKPIRDRGRALAPRRSGRLARSLRVSVQAYGIAITSRLPYANVIHWGGSTGEGHMPGVPWSGSVTVPASLFLSQAIEEQEDSVMRDMAGAVDTAAGRAGWDH